MTSPSILLLHCIQIFGATWLLENRTPFNNDTWLSWACCQRAVIQFCSPPLQIMILILQSKEQKNSHECSPSIQCCRQNIVVFLPPSLVVPEHKVVEDGSGDEPASYVGGSCRWHTSKAIRYNRYVYQRNPFLFREDFAHHPDWDWQDGSNEEQPYQVPVKPSRSKQPPWSYQTPYNRSIKRHPEFRTCPGAVRMESFDVTDVLNTPQHPPGNRKVDSTSNQCPHQLEIQQKDDTEMLVQKF